jgi:hypothetical protein
MKKFTFVVLFCLISAGVFSQEVTKDGETKINAATVTYKRKKPPENPPAPNSEPAPASPDKSETSEVQASKPLETSSKKVKLDTIIRLGGKKIGCNVQKINPTTVSYSKPNQSEVLEMPRKEIEKVLFRTGRKEIFNKPVIQMIDKTQWEAVLVTENPADVEGLYKKGVIRANASSDSRSPASAKTSATIRLQKKAANMGALIVLVVNSEMKGGYGEVPGWELDGIGYSDTPPPDSAAVNKAVRQMLEKRMAKNASDKKKKK